MPVPFAATIDTHVSDGEKLIAVKCTIRSGADGSLRDIVSNRLSALLSVAKSGGEIDPEWILEVPPDYLNGHPDHSEAKVQFFWIDAQVLLEGHLIKVGINHFNEHTDLAEALYILRLQARANLSQYEAADTQQQAEPAKGVDFSKRLPKRQSPPLEKPSEQATGGGSLKSELQVIEYGDEQAYIGPVVMRDKDILDYGFAAGDVVIWRIWKVQHVTKDIQGKPTPVFQLFRVKSGKQEFQLQPLIVYPDGKREEEQGVREALFALVPNITNVDASEDNTAKWLLITRVWYKDGGSQYPNFNFLDLFGVDELGQ